MHSSVFSPHRASVRPRAFPWFRRGLPFLWLLLLGPAALAQNAINLSNGVGDSGTFTIVGTSDTTAHITFDFTLTHISDTTFLSEYFKVELINLGESTAFAGLVGEKSGSILSTTRFPSGVYSTSATAVSGGYHVTGYADFTGSYGQAVNFVSTLSYGGWNGSFFGSSDDDSIFFKFGISPVKGMKTKGVGVSIVRRRGNEVMDPVDFVSGAFSVNCLDLQVNGPMPIEIRRIYSSRNPAVNDFGYGWLSSHSSYLYPAGDLSTVEAVAPNGDVVVLRRVGSSDVWEPNPTDNPEIAGVSSGASNLLNSQLTRTVDGGTTTYDWTLPDGSVLHYLVRQFPMYGEDHELPYLDQWTDNRGNFLTYTYGDDPVENDYGVIKKIASSNGTYVDLTYTVAGLISAVEASDGRTVGYTYNFTGDLTSVVLPDGATTTYEYKIGSGGEVTHLLNKETKPGTRILENTYDSSKRVTQQKATVGTDSTPVVNATFDYSVPGQTTVTDAYDRYTVYSYTGTQLTSVVDPLEQTETRTWYTETDEEAGAYQGSLESVTDKRGLVTHYLYDTKGNILEKTVTGDLVGDGSSEHTATTTYTFNSLNQPLTVTEPSGVVTTFTYGDEDYPYLPTQVVTSKDSTTLRTDKLEYTEVLDGTHPTTLFSKGLLERKTQAFGTADAAVTEYTYNTAGFITQQEDYTGTDDTDIVTTFAYNDRGEVITTTDADGRSTHYTYDGMSRVLTKTVKDESSVTLAVWTTTYTGNGEVATETGPQTSPANLVTRTYDGAGRPLSVVATRSQGKSDGTGVESAASATTSYVHDYFGNLTSMTDPNGNVTVFEYDEIGQMLSKSTEEMRTELFEYEPGGQVAEYTNPLGGVTSKFYTTDGKLMRQENPDGTVREWRFYEDGRVHKEILSNGTTWETVYDDEARTATRTLKASGGSTLATEIRAYDRRGNLVSLTDVEGYVHTTTYDGLNRPKVVTGPTAVTGSAQQVTATIYGASAKTVRVANAADESVTTTSDALGRPVSTVVKSAADAVIRSTTYAYSSDHHAVTVTEGTSTAALARTIYSDAAGKAVLTVLGDGKFTRTVYDLNGNVLSSTDALGQTTSYGYNELDQATSQTLPDSTVTHFTYDVAGGMLTRSMAGDTLTHEQTYDEAGRKLTERLYSGETETREYTYAYYDSGAAVGLLHTVTGPRTVTTTTYDDFLRPYTVATTGSLGQNNGTATYTYDKRGLATAIAQTSVSHAAGPDTLVERTFDGYGQMLTEVVSVAGSTHVSITQTWDAAGRRGSLNEAGSSLTGPLFAYTYQADGAMTQVAANGQNYGFGYANNGLLASRTNPYRTLTVNTRDSVGRVLQQTNTVSSSPAMVETMAWRDDSTLNTYGLSRPATSWTEARAYTYNSRGQLLTEGYAPASGQTGTLTYAFDGSSTKLGIRTDAKMGSGAPISWEAEASTINALGRATLDEISANPASIPATGVALGADHVDLLIDTVAQGRASHPGYTDATGTWSATLHVLPGTHTLAVHAAHPSGAYTATAEREFTVGATAAGGTITNAYDDDGNVTTRTWASGGRVQTLTWDAQNRLIAVVQRDSSNDGFDWAAVYDGLGRRLKTTHQAIVGNATSGSAVVTTSVYDPQVEFLEIGVAVDGAKAWKVYGPDLDGSFGSLQGTGGLEATIVDSGGATLGVISDQFGHGVGTVSSGTVTWSNTPVSSYGPIPGATIDGLTDITHVAAATAWRSRRVDPTGFIYLGARYYEPSSGRFLSTDPMGHGASMSLYDFANGDPANHFDPNGRFGKLTSRIGPDGLRFLDDRIYQRPNSRQRSLADESIFQGAGTAALHGAEAYAVGLMQGGWGAVTGAVHSVLHPGDTVTSTLAAIVELDERLHYDPLGLTADVGHAIVDTLTDPQRLGQAVGATVVSTALGEAGGALIRQGAAAASAAAESELALPWEIRGHTPSLRNPSLVDEIKADMLSGNYEYESARGIISGVEDSNGTIHLFEGQHRMNAALELFEETGNPKYVEKLLDSARKGFDGRSYLTPGKIPADSLPLPRRN